MQPQEFNIPGHERIKLHVYGVKVARTLSDNMAQAYYVALDGKATPRGELSEEQQEAVRAFLLEHWPQHAKI